MKVLGQFILSNRTFGYCSCGRELEKKDKNVIHCPLCNAKLCWEDEKNVKDK